MNVDLNELPDVENPNLIEFPNEGNDISLTCQTFGNDEPFVGQTFGSDEEAYMFYKIYAQKHGFAICKDRSEKKHDKIVRRDFSCHRGRKKPIKLIDTSKDQRIVNLQDISAMLICVSH